VDWAPQVADLLCSAFPEIFQLFAGTALRGGQIHKTILAWNCFIPALREALP